MAFMVADHTPAPCKSWVPPRCSIHIELHRSHRDQGKEKEVSLYICILTVYKVARNYSEIGRLYVYEATRFKVSGVCWISNQRLTRMLRYPYLRFQKIPKYDMILPNNSPLYAGIRLKYEALDFS